ncbi:inovirus Gp2 family protein [Stenotrophomonas maltophilia]|uniref:YagK/YfjJ domain-containing protein n=1 Tax=Stenotrophomonas maltophilia TaxID=40324 RepID=UPI002035A0B3|nr:inovirus-type Gp2 protein [Stenotrophomonas maltophilia]USA16233.1 inovirus Gp2 family protein [Stenotrophomonas maltophilia]
MLKLQENILDQWSDRAVECDDDSYRIHLSTDHPKEIVQIDQAMRALVKSQGELVKERKDGRRRSVDIDPVAEAVRRCASIDYRAIEKFYCKHKLSPYFRMLADEFRTTRASAITARYIDVEQANAWVEAMRERARASDFTDLLAAQERSARKNAVSALGYIRGLHRLVARLCVVRVDLAYSSDFRVGLNGTDVDSARIKQDLNRLLRVLRARYPALVGYVWKLEYGQSKSYHIHLMTIFNGSLIRQDVAVGKAIGEIWRYEITRGDGGYWNCNAHKDFYERRNGVGIGTVAYYDAEKRKRLEQALLYLTKVDYYVRLNDPEVGRTFGKGQLPAASARVSGRPRARSKKNAGAWGTGEQAVSSCGDLRLIL